MERERRIAGVDESLVVRVATLSPGGQRWLKTAIHAIATSEIILEAEEEEPQRAQRQAEPPEPEPLPKQPASLEDVITGKADLREHLEAYPELQDELEGLADVIDLLREAGETRRRRGEQILREEILGEGPDEGEDPGKGDQKPKRR